MARETVNQFGLNCKVFLLYAIMTTSSFGKTTKNMNPALLPPLSAREERLSTARAAWRANLLRLYWSSIPAVIQRAAPLVTCALVAALFAELGSESVLQILSVCLVL